MIKHNFVVVVFLLSFLLAGRPLQAYAQTATLDAYLQAQTAKHHIPGLTLAIAYSDGRIDVRTYGDGITPATRFRIGSLSKTMTAVAVLQLVEAGLVNLDAPIQTYLTDFTTQNAEWASQITVRHLLNHTSGISDLGYPSPADVHESEELIQSFARASHIAAPGRQFAYFNGNYDLLGRIVEVVSGQRYSTYMSEKIFTPIEMNKAVVSDDPTPIAVDGLAQGYILLYGFPIPYAEHLPIFAPSGGVIACGTDMAAFLRQFVIDKPDILSRESIRTMLTVPNGIDTPYAMGWFANRNGDQKHIFTHPGDVLTFHADMALLPDDGVAFALLYNRQNLLSTFTTYPEIRDGVMAILQGGKASGGSLSASVIGILILIMSAAAVVGDTRRLLTSRHWAARTYKLNAVQRGLSLLLLPIPLYILLFLPQAALALTGQALNFAILIAYLPDIMLLLAVTAVLSVLTLVVRLLIWQFHRE